MFYSQFILAKKGPLGTIWIAAHLERKLRKNQVADTDIGVSVDSILFPDAPIALRLSSHLLVGVVRIYSRKVNYLFDDCSEALLKIKQAFRSTAVDLPPEESTAPYHSITLPETFDLDDFELPDNEMFQGNYVDHHVSTREQITLQDTMEGVAYPTSQFGLDERFGDGDMSQIGLDLDEDLFLDKVSAPGHAGISDSDPHASAQLMTPLKEEEIAEQNERMVADANYLEYAPAPSTPGLLEEANLSAIQEAPTYDDQLEAEDHDFIDKAAGKNIESASHGEKNVVGEYLNNGNIICMSSEENDYHASLEIKQVQSADNHLITLSPSVIDGGAKPISLLSECSDTIGVTNGPDMVQDIHVNGTGLTLPSMNRNDAGFLESGEGMLGETVASSSHSNVGTDLEDHGHKHSSGLSSTDQMVSESQLEDSQIHQETCTIDQIVEGSYALQDCVELKGPKTVDPVVPRELASIHARMLKACSSHQSQPDVSIIEGENCVELKEPETVDPVVPKDLASVHAPVLIACSSHQSEPDVSFIEGEPSHATNVLLGPVSGETLALCKDIQEDLGKLDEQPENDLTNPANSDMPEPEKLLSASIELMDKPTDLILESTPEKEPLAGNDEGDAGMELISGKKRSFTESTPIIQSLNSVESFGVAVSKKTVESIPDDDDLLSSILVGRRPSVLKLKPTPPVLELASMKRPRTGPRGSSSKRKVLMDDPMVLHGDTIRQQLTSTEDIRRVRKKAPCTWPEISLIQRQFMEDAILSQPIITSASKELACLHNETYDLSGIMVSEKGECNKILELVGDVECSGKHDSTWESGILDISEVAVERNGLEEQHASPFPRTEIQQNEEHEIQEDEERALDLGNIDTQLQTDLIEQRSLQHEHVGDRTEMEVDEANESVHIVTESSFPVDPVPAYVSDGPAGSVITLADADKNTDKGPPLQTDILCMLSPKIMDSTVMDVSNGDGVGPVDTVECEADNHVSVENKSLPRDEFLLAETNDDIRIVNSAPSDEVNTSRATMSPCYEGCKNLESVNEDPAGEEIGEEKLWVVNEDENLNPEMGCKEKNLTFNHIFTEEQKLGFPYSEEPNMNMQNTHLGDGENPCNQEAGRPRYEEPTHYPSVEDLGDQENAAAENDTEFLNFDDDEVAEEDEDFEPSAGETHILENSGWSSRTRAVAKYLQTLFEKEAVQGKKVIPMANLLAGKTRKEASRMFFETLVLKTKDYIHVEQMKPFDNVNIKPSIKLVKSDF